MEKNNKEKYDMVCSCPNCQTPGYHSMHRFYLLRWFLGLVILGMVFAVGFKLGEFKGSFESEMGFGRVHDTLRFNRVYMPMTNTVPSADTTTAR